MKKRLFRVLNILAVIIVGVIIAMLVYFSIYYHADERASGYLKSDDVTHVTEIREGYFFDGPGTEKALVFYPGAKVEFTAYAPLMKMISDRGIDCFACKMPLNFALFGINKADNIIDSYDYNNWILAGHSLGGVAASSFANSHLDEVEGIVYLASYSTKDFSDKDIKILSIYGSEDGVVSMEKLMDAKELYPKETFYELVIDGGNHAGFGDYGFQKGDNEALVDNELQQEITADKIIEMFK